MGFRQEPVTDKSLSGPIWFGTRPGGDHWAVLYCYAAFGVDVEAARARITQSEARTDSGFSPAERHTNGKSSSSWNRKYSAWCLCRWGLRNHSAIALSITACQSLWCVLPWLWIARLSKLASP